MPLRTTPATVDGTDGDTWLIGDAPGPVALHCTGQVVRLKMADVQGQRTNRRRGLEIQGPKRYRRFAAGTIICLNINVDRARIEDFLRLTAHSGSSLLTGGAVKAKLHIPPGPAPVQERNAACRYFA